MLHFVALRHRPIRNFLDEWAPELARSVRLLDYATFFEQRHAFGGAWIFADVDLLPPAARSLAATLADQLVAGGVESRHLLNRPADVLGRFALLDLLHREGDNLFRVFALGERPIGGYRFPVIVRDRDHGVHSPLLLDARAIRRAVLALVTRGVSPRNLMIVELCDTADHTGVYRKYAYMRVGSRVFPAHVCFGNHWNVHWTAPSGAAHLAEQDAFFAGRAHEDQVQRTFEQAHIDYGRIDYGMLDGRMQVWEINTNPTLAAPAPSYPPEQLGLNSDVTLAVAAAWQAYADVASDRTIALRPPRQALARARFELSVRRARATWTRGVAMLERRLVRLRRLTSA